MGKEVFRLVVVVAAVLLLVAVLVATATVVVVASVVVGVVFVVVAAVVVVVGVVETVVGVAVVVVVLLVVVVFGSSTAQEGASKFRLLTKLMMGDTLDEKDKSGSKLQFLKGRSSVFRSRIKENCMYSEGEVSEEIRLSRYRFQQNAFKSSEGG